MCVCNCVCVPWGGSVSECVCLYVEHSRSPKPVDSEVTSKSTLQWSYSLISPVAQWVKNLPAKQETQETQVQSWVGKILWRRKWQLIPVFLSGKSCGQRSLLGYSP